MANIRNFNREKEKRQISYTEKLHRHKMSFVYRVVLALVIVCALVAAGYIYYRNHKYESYDVLSSQESVEVVGTTAVRLGNHAVVYSKDGAHCLGSGGKVKWNQTYEMQSPMVAVCENVVAIADYNGRRIYLYNDAEKLGEVNTTMPIRSICVSASGVVAAVLDDSDITWIRAFDTNGETLVDFKTSMKNYGYPFAVSLSPNSILCGVSYMYMDMGEVKSSIGFYNFGEVGQNQVDNFVGGYDYADTLVPYVQFMSDNTAFAVGDDRLVFYRGGQKPENVANILFAEELQAVYHNEEYVGLVFLSGSGKRLDVYNASGEKVISHPFDMDHTDILFDKDRYLIYNERELYIGTMDGIEKYNGIFEKSVKLLVPTGKSYQYTVITKDSIDVIRMR
ncbi:MAG: hypothetical protein E7293_09280 [Lachnospiraceae bacterium]|nr:hypothetical protein [Lachnospiraceae bacterium]